MFTAEQAAVELVPLAREHFPDSALARSENFSKPYDDTFSLVDSELGSRGLVNSLASDKLEVTFELYLPKLLAFPQKPSDLDGIYAALCKGNIYRQTAKQKKTEPSLSETSLSKALAQHLTWTVDPRHRLLIFLRLFKQQVIAGPSGFVAKDSTQRVYLQDPATDQDGAAARLALQTHGTPVRLLELFYRKLNVRLVIYSGATCAFVHTPVDWDQRSEHHPQTVVINVWSNHVFTYNREIHNRQFTAHISNPAPESALISLQDAEDRYEYDQMIPLNWDLLWEQLQAGKRGSFFYTTDQLTPAFFIPLEDFNVAFIPYWPSTEACAGLFT